MDMHVSHPPAIVLGTSYAALSAVQSLGVRGVKCWVCHSERSIASQSRYARYWRVPNPQDDERGSIDRILELVSKMAAPPVILPAGDQYSQALARNRNEFEQSAILCVASDRVVDMLVDKKQFAEYSQSRSLSCPRTIPASDFESTNSISFPIVVKRRYPVWSNASSFNIPCNRTLRPFTFRLIESPGQWETFRAAFREYFPHLILQEFVRGTTADMYSVGIYADQSSEIKARFVGRKIRGFPATYGNTKAGQNDAVSESVLREVANIIRDVGYRGIAEFDYKRDVVTGRFHLLEINPRCWSWMGITAATQADIAWIAYRDLSGNEVPTALHDAKPGSIKYVQLLPDFRNVVLRYRSDYPKWVASPAQWWKSLESDRLVIAEMCSGDWPVAAWSIVKALKRLLLTLLAPLLSLSGLSTTDSCVRTEGQPPDASEDGHQTAGTGQRGRSSLIE